MSWHAMLGRRGPHLWPCIGRFLAPAVGIIACFNSVVIGAPSVQEVQGIVEDGAQITLFGSGFGASGPTVLFFDDLEGGTAGQTIRTGPGSARVGQWNALGSNEPYYANQHSVSGSLSFQADMSQDWFGYGEVLLPGGTQEIFATWWIFLPSGDLFPGQGGTDNVNWKTVWLQGEGTTDNDQIFPTILGPPSLLNESQLSYCFCGNDTPYNEYIQFDFRKGVWKRVWIWVKAGQNGAGKAHLWWLGDAGVVHALSADAVTIGNLGESYQRIRINGYGRATSNCHPTFDDIYVSTGAGCVARVELGNAATYTACTKLTITTTTSWSDNQIGTVVRRGAFGPGEAAYVYVVDANGAVSNPGRQVVFGQGADPASPGLPGMPVRE